MAEPTQADLDIAATLFPCSQLADKTLPGGCGFDEKNGFCCWVGCDAHYRKMVAKALADAYQRGRASVPVAAF